jgi:hypothetical protein
VSGFEESALKKLGDKIALLGVRLIRQLLEMQACWSRPA